GSLASSSLDIDPSRTAEHLGFSDTIRNSFDAVAATDHVLAAINAACSVVATIARFIDEVSVWLRVQPDAIQFSEEALNRDPALPQWTTSSKLSALASAA